MFVKICGLTDPEAVAAAVAAGADAIGFVFAPSPREVDAETAARLAEAVPASVLRVAVMRHPAQALVDEVCATFAPDWLQTDAQDLAALCVDAGIRTLPVYRNDELPTATACPARLLFEGPVSGSGQRADWRSARHWAERTELILAGGLDADNVADAIAAVAPWGVDVSSGVERQRGRKAPDKIYDFVARIRALETTHA